MYCGNPVEPDIGYAALAVAILCDCTPEQAFLRLYPEVSVQGKASPHGITRADLDTMRRLKARGQTYRQIAEQYDIKQHHAWTLLNRPPKYLQEVE